MPLGAISTAIREMVDNSDEEKKKYMFIYHENGGKGLSHQLDASAIENCTRNFTLSTNNNGYHFLFCQNNWII